MKRCPECRRDYYDDSLLYCLDDGSALLEGPVSGTESMDEPATAMLHQTDGGSEAPTRAQVRTTGQTAILPRPADRALSSRKGSLIAGAVGIVLVTALGLGSYWLYGRGGTKQQIDSVAVMPFANESGNSDIEYLSDGMTEMLIGSLTQLPNLNVKARSSVFRYKGKETDAKTLGRELNVQAILNGRVAQHGDQLTLSLELVDAATENAIWSRQYIRKQADLVSLQSEIARDVSSRLKSKLSGADAANVEKTYTSDPEAYQLYLKGRFQWNKRTAESLRLAVELFDQAIEKDANYALAYSGLAESYVLFPNYSVETPLDCMPKAKSAALRAIELDESLAEAHVALGIYLSTFSWDQLAAEKEFQRAIELNPNYATAHQQYANYCLTAMQRFDESITEAKKAETLDPLSPVISMDVGANLGRARRYDEAIEQLNRTLTIDPNFYATRYALGTVLHAKGQYSEAVAEYRKALALSDDPWPKALLARSLARSGQRGEARKLLGELQSESARRYVPSSGLAVVFAALGEKDKAFASLEKDVEERSPRPPLYAVNPVFDDLRSDPRFPGLLRRIEASKID